MLHHHVSIAQNGETLALRRPFTFFMFFVATAVSPTRLEGEVEARGRQFAPSLLDATKF